MTTLVAARAALRLRATGEPVELSRARELGAGGEARVFALSGGRVAKVYHAPTAEYERKLECMVAHPPVPAGEKAAEVRLAWPLDLLDDEEGRFAGYVMPWARWPRVFEYYNPRSRRAEAPLFHHGLLHRAGRNLARAFAALHAAGYVVGDVNESNVLLSSAARVTVVDTDSFQVRDPRDGRVHRCVVGKPEFTPPELQGVVLARVDRAPEHDRFGLGVLLFLLLMEGTHPFALRTRGGDALPVETRIRDGLFPYAGTAGEAHAPPRLAPDFGILDPDLRALFDRCFVDGHADPASRPSAEEWAAALEAAEEALVECGANPQHRHGTHRERCPWCERRALLKGRDPFPSPAEAARLEPVSRAAPQDGRGRAAALAVPAVAAPAPAAPAPAIPPAPPLPANLLDRYGVREPWVWAMPLAVLGLMSPVAVFSLPILVGAAGMSVTARKRPVRAEPLLFSIGLALAMMFLIVAMMAAGADAPSASPASPPAAGPAEAAVTYHEDDVAVLPILLDRAEVARRVERSYPPLLRDAGVTGRVVLRFRVDAEGRLDEGSVEVVEATHDAFGRAAREALRGARFSPARVNSQPVAVVITLPVEYTLW